jgi:adenine phosphoribosyltransferase
VYSGESSYSVTIGRIHRDLPVVRISPDLWIASNAKLILGDVDLLTEAAALLAEKVARKRPDIILTAEAKSIALAYELSRRLKLKLFIVARKSVKAYMGEHVSQKVRSITTEVDQELHLTREEMTSLHGKRVCLLDDVVSTGGTLRTLESLVAKARGTVVCRATIWREGPWYRKSDLVYLDTLPVFVRKKSRLPRDSEVQG